MPPHLRSRAKAAAAGAAAAPQSPPAGLPPQGTPAPSPTTSLPLGLAASPDGFGAGAGAGALGLGLKSPAAAAPPRRSLRLAGGGSSPGTPAAAPDGATSGSGSGSGGSGKRARARVSASPKSGSPGNDGGGSPAGGGAGLFGAPRIAKRRMEPGGARAIGDDAGIGSPGEGQVHDEMLHRDVGTPSKRVRRVLVGGVETVCVDDTESESEEDRFELAKMPAAAAQVCAGPGPGGIDLNAPAVNVDVTEEGDGGSKAGVLEPLLRTPYLLWTEVSGVAGQSAYPEGSPSHPEAEIYADMYFKEGLRRYSPRQAGKAKAKEKLVLGNNDSRADANAGSAFGASSSKLGPDSKGKEKMIVEDSLEEPGFEPVHSKETQSDSVSASYSESYRKQAARDRAIKLAPKFAFFKPEEDEVSEEDEAEELEPAADPQDWPGPFATAARVYEEREAKLRARELNSSKLDKSSNRGILWLPSKDRKNPRKGQAAPSLTSLCLNTLVEHSECIESLGGIPEELKHRLLKLLCRSRKMNAHLLTELLCDSPTQLHLCDCSWLSEDNFEKTFGKCSTESLEDLQLDISGRCMPDYILPTTLAKVSNCMPLLRKISLKGNYRLSDKGLGTLISSAPSLSSINLCECSLLSSSGIDILANKLHSVLRELYIDDCTNVDAMMILPALQRINHLEVLSMSGIQSVSDKFVSELIHVHGSNMKGLAFAGCLKLTSSSVKTIGENCPQLTSLDLRNLNRLRDSAMRHLRKGCRLIRKLRLQRNTFSDEAVSRYLEESGGCLTELMLNNVEKIGDLTALAISRNCSARLEALDLSFCRELTNEALGLIVDSCSSLKILKLFGCTQITNFFLQGHSNTLVKIVGIEGSILKQMDNR
ncbi:hypothetical protein U9M48_038641 [Paspalum notatum var. saurae]|uniref:Rad7 n=1 Tax=Paspalum notatum var. saurae TaxID=547442 RepID=A0AAQ3XC97_PASNO